MGPTKSAPIIQTRVLLTPITQNVYGVNTMSTQTADILASARDLYLEEGLSGVSMRKVASRVGLTATAIYRHFASKEELLERVTEEAFRLFGSYLYKALEGETPEERFALSGQAYVNFALEQPRYYEMMFMGPVREEGVPLSVELERYNHATFQFLTDRVRECMDTGFLKKEDPYEVATTIWSHTHGLVSLYLTGNLAADEARFLEIFDASGRYLLAGLAKIG